MRLVQEARSEFEVTLGYSETWSQTKYSRALVSRLIIRETKLKKIRQDNSSGNFRILSDYKISYWSILTSNKHVNGK